MATQYTSKKVGGDFEIYRNSEHVATFDPVSEDVTYTNGNDKYAGPIGKEVVSITSTAPVVEEVPEPVPEPAEYLKLRKRIIALEKENLALKAPKTANRIPKRYQGIPFGAPGSPPMGKMGDITPEYVEWARNGGYTKDQWLQAYAGRIKDLTYKA